MESLIDTKFQFPKIKTVQRWMVMMVTKQGKYTLKCYILLIIHLKMVIKMANLMLYVFYHYFKKNFKKKKKFTINTVCSKSGSNPFLV